MLRPRKMNFIELSALKSDIDTVLEYFGRKGAIHFPDSDNITTGSTVKYIKKVIDRIQAAASFIGIDFKNDNGLAEDDNVNVPTEEEKEITAKICSRIEDIRENHHKKEQERKRIQETLNESQAFAKMRAPFSELDQLSYLTLRIGRLDQKGQEELRENLGDRAVIIPLDAESGGNRVLAASSRKGRFALDTQLKKVLFEPIAVPQEFKGIPSEMIQGLKDQLALLDEDLEKIEQEKQGWVNNYSADLARFLSSWKKALLIEEIKSGFTETESLYHFSGWVPMDLASEIANELFELTGGRVAIKIYHPEEVPSIIDGTQKVPVYVKHGAFVKGFEKVVFSYGAPLYGTIDPTPLVAFFFTILFGIMFGDIGHGFTLLIAGLIVTKSQKLRAKFNNFRVPLISIGISSMFFGFLFGAVFSNEHLLIALTRAISKAVTGIPVDRFVAIMPLEETGGSLVKLMYFFGFTVAIGMILISIGLIINIFNMVFLKKYEKAFFSKTGLAGLLLFWYAIFLVVRMLLGGHFVTPDILGFVIPVVCIFFGPLIWRIITRKKPVLEHGLMTFIMEGFVELLETLSTYVSNTVSFLRVGAFALSHAVLSFIVFTLSAMLARNGAAGVVGAGLIMIFGNIIIIVLEGMIVAIQVMRLQYYEFFNKFFVETGVEFSPFRFRTKNIK